MKIVVTRKIPESGIDLLRDAGFSIDYHDSTTKLTKSELMKKLENAQGLICLLDDVIDCDVMATSSELKIVANYAVGYDNIDLEAAQELGIMVTNTPDVLSNATADLAFALLISVARRIVEGHQYLLDRKDQGGFNGWGSTLLLGSELSGKTLGVIGAGRIGSVMVKRGLGFDMKVLYYARSEKPDLNTMGSSFADLDTITRECDFISLHLPLTEETAGMFDKERLIMMKDDAYLINTGRGKLIKENDLVDVLKSGHLSGVGLDVFEDEPKIHPGLYELDNVVMTPHIGSATIWAREKMSTMCGQAILDIHNGKTPDNIVI